MAFLFFFFNFFSPPPLFFFLFRFVPHFCLLCHKQKKICNIFFSLGMTKRLKERERGKREKERKKKKGNNIPPLFFFFFSHFTLPSFRPPIAPIKQDIQLPRTLNKEEGGEEKKFSSPSSSHKRGD